MIAKFKINWQVVYRSPTTNKSTSIEHLRNPAIQQQYHQRVKENLNSIVHSTTQHHWDSICKICLDSAEKLQPPKHKNKPSNPIIEQLSNKQKNIRVKIEQSTDREQIRELKKERNSILKSIHVITKNAEADKLLENIKEIENSKDDSRRMFKAIQVINKKSNTNIVVCNSEGEIAGNTSKKIEYITDHFKKTILQRQ